MNNKQPQLVGSKQKKTTLLLTTSCFQFPSSIQRPLNPVPKRQSKPIQILLLHLVQAMNIPTQGKASVASSRYGFSPILKDVPGSTEKDMSHETLGPSVATTTGATGATAIAADAQVNKQSHPFHPQAAPISHSSSTLSSSSSSCYQGFGVTSSGRRARSVWTPAVSSESILPGLQSSRLSWN